VATLADPIQPKPAAGSKDDVSIPTLLKELRDLVVAYAKQQTLDPLKALGRFVALGVAGGIFVGIGVVLLAVGTLRGFQSETQASLQGHLSWLPYVIAFGFCVIVAALMIRRISKVPAGKER
jgi:H+/Cl- antiporter ClcA